MGISMTMEQGGFIDGLRSLITPDVVAKASSAFGESEASVMKGLTAAVPMVMGGLAVKAGDRSLMSRVFDLVKDPAAEGSVLGNISSLLGPGSSSTPGVSLGNRLMSMLFGSSTDSLGRALSNFAGVRPSTAASMLSLAAPLALGHLGRTVRSEGLDASGLSRMLLGQKNAILRLVPAAFSNVFGAGAQVADTVVRKASPWRWVVPLLLAVLAVWLLVSLFGNRNPVDYITRSIPGGVQLQYARHGVEGKLLSFIEDSTQSVDRQVWFDFDRLLFETNSAVLKSGSQDQLRNIAAILKAYPNARVKIGGYTDTSGDPAANMKLSQDRANSVMQELTNLGVASGRLSAEGYGGTNPVADNATEAGRARNRRVALRVTEK